jgi:hypothetical protein
VLLKNAGTDFLHVIAKEVSHRLKDEFDNGKEYYALQGKSILLPDLPLFRSSEERLNKRLPPMKRVVHSASR